LFKTALKLYTQLYFDDSIYAMIIKYSVNQKFSCTQFKKSKFVKFFIVKKIM